MVVLDSVFTFPLILNILDNLSVGIFLERYANVLVYYIIKATLKCVLATPKA